MTQRCYSNWC